MFALSQWVREWPSSVVAASAVASLALGSTPTAQCSDEAVLHHLDAGTVAPVLRTPKGAAVIGGGFSLRVFDAAPSSTGILFYGAFENPVFDPLLGATVWPATPWFTKSFGTSAQGVSGAQFNTAVVTDDLCGAFATFQTVVVDANHPSGFTITNAVRLRVGIVTEPVFGPLEETASYNDVVFADVDGDALRDRVVAEASSFSVSLGLLTGGFGAPVTYGDVGGSTRAPLVADLDGDGNTDLIDASGDVGVILLDASGGVLGATSFDAGPSVTDGVLGDFDLDGALDLAVTLQGGGLGWMEGVGDGSLLFPQAVVVGGSASQVEAGHMDGDGGLDLVVSTSATVVALGNGDGTFTALAPAGPVALAGLSVLDLDGDGELDVAGFSGKTLGVQLGNGNGTLGSFQGHVAADAFLKDYVFADLDGDGMREGIAVPGQITIENVFVSAGSPGGTFGPRIEYGGVHDPKAVAAVDADLDGAMDVMVVGDESTLTLRGNGDGTLRGSRVLTAGKMAGSVIASDLDGNGLHDALVLNTISGDVSVLVNTPMGPVSVGSFPVGPEPISFATGDFDGDQVADVVIGDYGTPTSLGDIRVLLGDGSGGFAQAVVTPTAFRVSTLVVADFDEDGFLDVATGTDNAFQPSRIHTGNGDGTFGAPSLVPVDGNVNGAGRLNADVHVDLLVCGPTGSVVLLGNGDGTFVALAPIASNVCQNEPEFVDIDRDDDLDLVTILSSGSRTFLVVGLGAGDGTFAVQTGIEVALYAAGLAVSDFDEDSLPDVAVADRAGSTLEGNVRLLHGNGDGTFTPLLQIPAGAVVRDVAAGDFDGDGIPDVVSTDVQTPTVVTDLAGRVWFLLNQVGE